MLVLQIALGIVLAVILLALLPYILALGIGAMILAVGAGIVAIVYSAWTTPGALTELIGGALVLGLFLGYLVLISGVSALKSSSNAQAEFRTFMKNIFGISLPEPLVRHLPSRPLGGATKTALTVAVLSPVIAVALALVALIVWSSIGPYATISL